MVRAFRIGILKFLREHDATTSVMDIKTPFLSELETMDKRKAFKQALDTLSNEKLIVVSGSYDFLNWKLINGLYPIDDKIVEAKITEKGLTYEQPAEPGAKTNAAPERIDMPLPPAVKALSTLFAGTRGITEERLKAKMKKMGAKDSHLEFVKKEGIDRMPRYKHVPAVRNPLIDDTLEANKEIDALTRISLNAPMPDKKAVVINKLLKWVVIVVSVILVVLIVLIFRANS